LIGGVKVKYTKSMNTPSPPVRVILPLLFLLAFTAAAEEVVSIYQQYQPQEWGRAADRQGLLAVTENDMKRAPTVKAAEGGHLTGVILNRSQGEELLALLRERSPVVDGQITLSLVSDTEKPVIEWFHKGWDARYHFQLEEAPRELLNEVVRFYAKDPFNGGLVDREYRDNFIIRILAGEDVFKADGELSFGEALAGATLLGDDFQPFFGFHDGRGILSRVGLLRVAERQRTETRPAIPEDDSRVIASPARGVAWADFMHRVESLPGNFPENLYVYTRTVCDLIEGFGVDYLSPRSFLEERAGTNRDFSLFFYQVLEEYGYEVRLVMINPGEMGENYYIVTFRSAGSPLWGVISRDFYAGQRFSQWARIPALLHQRSVLFQELQGARILGESRWVYPGSSEWKDSLY